MTGGLVGGGGQLAGRAWPTGMVERPGPREAWRLLLAAAPGDVEDARAVFIAACNRASR